MSSFHRVLSAADLPPGSMREVRIDGRDIALANVDGHCYAFGGVCTHDGAPLAEGELTGRVVTCHWHGTEFDVATGAVVDGLTDEAVPVYEVRVVDGGIEVSIP
jgi:nitrite reductase/ring-hydroxylating ferredoxin subunit